MQQELMLVWAYPPCPWLLGSPEHWGYPPGLYLLLGERGSCCALHPGPLLSSPGILHDPAGNMLSAQEPRSRSGRCCERAAWSLTSVIGSLQRRGSHFSHDLPRRLQHRPCRRALTAHGQPGYGQCIKSPQCVRH